MQQLLQDLKFGLRILTKAPAATAIILLSLALGIGANATVFCWIERILRNPIPGAVHPEQIVGLVSNQGSGNTSLPDIRDLGSLQTVFAGAVASQLSPANLTFNEQSDWIFGQVATANLFKLLGVEPMLGRTFLPDEDLKPGGNPVLVISETLWRRRFGGDPGVLGQVVKINRLPYTIVGVTPRAFAGTMTGLACDFWAPISMYDQVAGRADDIHNRSGRGFHNLARLQPGVTIEQAQAAVSLLDSQLAATYPRNNREVRHRVVPYSKVPYGAQQILGPALRILLAVSMGVLLIVAANVANLLLARATGRQKEFAIRLAAGASRWQLVRQLLTESLLLAFLGGVGGILVASWGVSLISRFLPATNLPVSIFDYHLDAATLGMTMLVTLSTGILFGIVPALKTSQLNLSSTLKESGRTAVGNASHHRWRHALVVTEIALSLVLLVGAGLCYKGLKKAQAIQIGFNPDHVLTASLPLAMSGYRESNGRDFYQQLLQQLAVAPGVEEATYASWLPLGLGGCKGHGVDVDGYLRRPGENPTYEYAIVAPRYFTTLRIPLVAGRDFTDLDRNDTQNVAIVNGAFAAHFWPGQNVLGHKFRAAGKEWTIIGLVPTGKYNRLNEAPWSFFYLPYQQYVPDLDLNVVVRTKGDPAGFLPTLNQIVRGLDANTAILGGMPLTDHVAASLFVQQMASKLLATMGLIALLLAAMGVYAVMAYSVGQRIPEFGIRMALGAQSRNIVWDVVSRGLRITAVGITGGLIMAFNLSPWLSGFLYGVSSRDTFVFVSVPSLLTLVALLACFVPAHRATRVDPMSAVRSE